MVDDKVEQLTFEKAGAEYGRLPPLEKPWPWPWPWLYRQNSTGRPKAPTNQVLHLALGGCQ